MATPKYELLYFMENFEEEKPVVRVNVRWNDKFGTEPSQAGLDFQIPSAELEAIATAASKTSWDEEDILTWFKTVKKETRIKLVTRRQPPKLP